MKKLLGVLILVVIAFVSPALAVDEFYSDCKIITYKNGDLGVVCKDGDKTKVFGFSRSSLLADGVETKRYTSGFGFSPASAVLEGVDKKTRTVAVETPNGIKTFVEKSKEK